MKMNEVERILKDALTPMDRPSESLNSRIRNSKTEGKNMKTIKRGRVIILVAAMCLVLGTAAFAAGFGGYSTSVSDPSKEETNYNKLNKIAAEAGFTFHAVEEFSNGFRFASVNTSDSKNVDEEGNVTKTYKSVTLRYADEKDQTLYLSIIPADSAGTDNDYTESFESGGINYYYSSHLMKLLPQDYVMSEEEKQQMDAGTVWFSSGGDNETVEESTWRNMCWSDGECYYNLSSDEAELTANEMLTMAKEVIKK